MTKIRAGFLTSAAAAVTLMLGGCSPGDVELNGKLFDAVGATGLVGKASGQAKLSERQPLVVPPALDKLPQPGAQAPQEPALAEIKDPDQAKVVTASDLERRQAEYCKANYEPLKARGDATADSVTGPAGPCRNSVLTAFSKWNKGD
jgi:hypothetical protein